MIRCILLLLVLSSGANAQTVTPSWTTGSMNSNTNSTQVISETIQIQTFGGQLQQYQGTNITPSGSIINSETTYTITDAAKPWTLEIVTRPQSSVIEQQDITRTIETTSATTALSVFSQ